MTRKLLLILPALQQERDRPRYDTDHAVFQPARLSPQELEEGHVRAYRDFLSYRSILKRSFGLSGSFKRLAYNLSWMKIDPLWVGINRLGLMPFARRILSRVLKMDTRATPPAASADGERAALPSSGLRAGEKKPSARERAA